jgi:hypothetical protein
MANDVTSKVIFGLDPSEFRRGIQQVDAKLKETSKLFSNLGQAVGAAFAVGQIQAFTAEAIQLGSQMQTVGKGFARFGDQARLEELRKATRGLVTDLDLMKATVMAGNFGIPIEELGTLLEFAKRRAQETGQSVDYLVESIVTGIGRKSPLILDNLGISTTRLKEKFNGAAIEAQGIADVARAVGDIATEELGKMGTAVDTAADKMVRLTTTWQNFKAKVGEAIAPAASAFLEGLTNMLNVGETMGPALNKLGMGAGLAKPSDLIKPTSTTSPMAAQAVEVQKVVVSLESMRQAIKDLETEYNTTQVGTQRFYELRNAIEEANYQLGRASGEIYPGTTAELAKVNALGLQPVTNGLVYQEQVMRATVIPAYSEFALMIQGAKDQQAAFAAQLQAASIVGAEFGFILSEAFKASVENGEDFFQVMKKALLDYVKQMAIALATTTALAAIFTVVTGGAGAGFGSIFGAISKTTGLGSFFGEGGLFNMKATVSGSDLILGTDRANNNRRRSGG